MKETKATGSLIHLPPVRGETITYSSRKKKEKEKLQKQLEEEIAKLEKACLKNL